MQIVAQGNLAKTEIFQKGLNMPRLWATGLFYQISFKKSIIYKINPFILSFVY
jgi:hypothetical protein